MLGRHHAPPPLPPQASCPACLLATASAEGRGGSSWEAATSAEAQEQQQLLGATVERVLRIVQVRPLLLPLYYCCG